MGSNVTRWPRISFWASLGLVFFVLCWWLGKRTVGQDWIHLWLLFGGGIPFLAAAASFDEKVSKPFLIVIGTLIVWPVLYMWLFSVSSFLVFFASLFLKGGYPCFGFEPWGTGFITHWLSAYSWTFAVLAIVVAIAIVRHFRSGRTSRLDQLPNNCWSLPVYAWALQSAHHSIIATEESMGTDFPIHPLGFLLLPMFGVLAVLLCIQSLAVLLFDREQAPDGLGDRVSWGAKIAVIAIIVDSFFYLALVYPVPAGASLF